MHLCDSSKFIYSFAVCRQLRQRDQWRITQNEIIKNSYERVPRCCRAVEWKSQLTQLETAYWLFVTSTARKTKSRMRCDTGSRLQLSKNPNFFTINYSHGQYSGSPLQARTGKGYRRGQGKAVMLLCFILLLLFFIKNWPLDSTPDPDRKMKCSHDGTVRSGWMWGGGWSSLSFARQYHRVSTTVVVEQWHVSNMYSNRIEYMSINHSACVL